MLSFGTIKVIDDKLLLNKKLSTIGPDIMNIDTTLDVFTSSINRYKNKK